MPVAVVEQGFPFHELHDEVGLAVLGRPAVEEPGDVGVIEQSRDLAFAAETLHRELARHAGANQLDGGQLFELLVGAAREIDHSHPAASELSDDLVGADPLAEAQGRVALLERIHAPVRGAIHEAPRLLGGGGERLHLSQQSLVPRAGCLEECGTPVGAQVQGFVKDLLDPLPPLGVGPARHHGLYRGPISRRSQARAVLHSRLTVAAEMPSTSAVSSTVSPAKKRNSTILA